MGRIPDIKVYDPLFGAFFAFEGITSYCFCQPNAAIQHPWLRKLYLDSVSK